MCGTGRNGATAPLSPMVPMCKNNQRRDLVMRPDQLAMGLLQLRPDIERAVDRRPAA